MVHQAGPGGPSVPVTPPQRHLQGVQHQLGPLVGGRAPADDGARLHVHDEKLRVFNRRVRGGLPELSRVIRGRQCGTCEVEIAEDSPNHRCAVLIPEQQSTNLTMMACLPPSRSRDSGRLTRAVIRAGGAAEDYCGRGAALFGNTASPHLHLIGIGG